MGTSQVSKTFKCLAALILIFLQGFNNRVEQKGEHWAEANNDFLVFNPSEEGSDRFETSNTYVNNLVVETTLKDIHEVIFVGA